MPGSLNHQKGENMKIDRSYLGNQNTYAENNPKCIVVHNTDNFAAGADARAHARAQHDGNFQNISAHYYVDDGDTAYQAAPHSRGCWHVGINYGGKNLFQQYGNKNSIGVEMCVQAGYNYEKAFENTAALVREQLFKAQRYMQDLEKAAEDPDEDEPEFDMKCEALLPVRRRELPVHIHAHRADDIFTALRIAKEFDVDITLDHCTPPKVISSPTIWQRRTSASSAAR